MRRLAFLRREHAITVRVHFMEAACQSRIDLALVEKAVMVAVHPLETARRIAMARRSGGLPFRGADPAIVIAVCGQKLCLASLLELRERHARPCGLGHRRGDGNARDEQMVFTVLLLYL